MRYLWKNGSHLKGDSDAVGHELRRIEDQAGVLVPGDVVHQSEGLQSILHSFFEWDDGIAGNLYREDQARHLLRSIVVEIEQGPGVEPLLVRAFHAVVTSEDSENGREYVNSVRIWSEPDLRQQVLARALSELQALEKRYAEYCELDPLREVIGQIRERVETRDKMGV